MCICLSIEYTVGERSQNDTCLCSAPCYQVIYDPVISFSALTEQTASEILTETEKLAQKFHRARETQDRVNKDSFVSYLEVFLLILDGFGFEQVKWEQNFRKVKLALNFILDMYKRDTQSLHKTARVLNEDYELNIKGRLHVLLDSIEHLTYDVRLAKYSQDSDLMQKLAKSSVQINDGIEAFIDVRQQWLDRPHGEHPPRVFTLTEKDIEENCNRILYDLSQNLTRMHDNTQFGIDSHFLSNLLDLLRKSRGCFGNYFESLQKTLAVFTECQHEQMENTMHNIDETLEHYDFRTKSASLFQDEQFLRGHILRYLNGETTKLALAGELSDLNMSRIITTFKYFFDTFEVDLIQSQKIHIHTLEDQYKQCYKRILQQIGSFEFYFKRNKFEELDNLDIWLRPLVSLSNSFIDTTETNTKAVVFSKFGGSLQGGFGGSENSAFISQDADRILDEHMMSYFHGIDVALKEFTNDIHRTTENLVLSLEQLRRLLDTYRTKSKLNEEYIR